MVIRAVSPETFNFKDLNYWLMEFPLPHLEAHSWAYGINRHLWYRDENVVRVRAIFKTKIKFFLVNIYFVF